MIKVDVSTKPFLIARLHHYTDVFFNVKIGHKIIGAGNINWANATGQQSCAMRVSIALAYAGVHWPQLRNSWRLRDTNVYFPSSAGDYPNLLKRPETIISSADISGRHGVIYFGGAFSSASGHVTLWDNIKCHFGHNDAHWSQPQKYFWEMA